MRVVGCSSSRVCCQAGQDGFCKLRAPTAVLAFEFRRGCVRGIQKLEGKVVCKTFSTTTLCTSCLDARLRQQQIIICREANLFRCVFSIHHSSTH
jgi:hypothetical protein